MHPSRLRFSYAGDGGSTPGSRTGKERGWGPHQQVKAAGGARARWAIDGAVEGGGVAQTTAGCQLLGGGKEAQDSATQAQGICGKERRRSIGAPQMEKGSCRAAHRRRRVSGKKRKGCAGLLTGGEGPLLYWGGAAGRRVVGEGIQPLVAAIKVSKVELHREKVRRLYELYDCC
jgi:hypothetical protein